MRGINYRTSCVQLCCCRWDAVRGRILSTSDASISLPFGCISCREHEVSRTSESIIRVTPYSRGTVVYRRLTEIPLSAVGSSIQRDQNSTPTLYAFIPCITNKVLLGCWRSFFAGTCSSSRPHPTNSTLDWPDDSEVLYRGNVHACSSWGCDKTRYTTVGFNVGYAVPTVCFYSFCEP